MYSHGILDTITSSTNASVVISSSRYFRISAADTPYFSASLRSSFWLNTRSLPLSCNVWCGVVRCGAVWCCVVPCYTALCRAVPCHAALFRTAPRLDVAWHAMPLRYADTSLQQYLCINLWASQHSGPALLFVIRMPMPCCMPRWGLWPALYGSARCSSCGSPTRRRQ